MARTKTNTNGSIRGCAIISSIGSSRPRGSRESQEYYMAARKLLVACGLAFAFSAPALLAQSAKPALPRTPDGHVDLQGIWDFRSATALERPARFAGREFMTADEVV